MSCLTLVDCSKQLDVSIGAAKKSCSYIWGGRLAKEVGAKNIPFKWEVAVMRTILSLPNLRPGQESSWIKTFRSHLNIPSAREETRRMLLFYYVGWGHINQPPIWPIISWEVLVRILCAIFLMSWEKLLRKEKPSRSQPWIILASNNLNAWHSCSLDLTKFNKRV